MNSDSAAAIAESGFDVERTDSVEAAIERSERDRVECVVSSHDPPEVDGLVLAERLRERRLEVPLVLVPVDGSEALASEAVEAGVSAYVPGTDTSERLVTAIARAVERGRERLEYREIFENADVGLSIYDVEDGTLLDVNERHCEL
ncbi:MAG: response regulator, partial [Halobacteriales archaeon]|nr:response regulator [Halobacteriales archaeon]